MRHTLARERTPVVAGVLAVVLVSGACRSDRPTAVFPTTPANRYGLAVIGDFGTGDTSALAVASSMRRWAARHPFHALVTVGDNVYGSSGPTRLAQTWERPYGWVDRSGIETIASLGNNDVDPAKLQDVMTLFGMPGRWYRDRVGFVDLFILDTNEAGSRPQQRWLLRALQASTGSWQIAVFHDPLYSCSGTGGRRDLRDHWGRLFERFGIDLVLAGHHHSYQRFDSLNGIVYIVTGGGGAPLHGVEAAACPPDIPELEAWDDQTNHFLYLSAGPNDLKGWAVASSGSILDSFELRPGE